MLTRLSSLVATRARTVIVVWIVGALTMAAVALVGIGDGGGLFDRVQSGAPGVKSSDSSYVMEQAIASRPDNQGPTVSALFQGVDLADPAVAQAVSAEADHLATLPHVKAVVHPFGFALGAEATPADLAGNGGDPIDLIADSQDAFLLQVNYFALPEDASAVAVHREVEDRFALLAEQISTDQDPVSQLTYSDPLLFEDFTDQMKRDLITGEAVALPLALIVMVLVFGGFLAASIPLIGALASIASGLLVLYGFTYPITMDDSAVNVVTVLAIGLSIDYGLLMVSRYREEVGKRTLGDVAAHREALEVTLTTAGRTVFYSAVTVAIAVGGMLTFEPEILRGIGAAALGAVTMAMLAALTLVPAIAFLNTEKIAMPAPISRLPGFRTLMRSTADVKRDFGAFSSLAARVQRRPWLTLIASGALLMFLASPLLGLQLRNSQVELLPADNERRQFIEEFEQGFPGLTDTDLPMLTETTPAEFDQWLSENVAGLPGVERVSPARVQMDDAVAGVYLETEDGGSAEAVAVVEAIRALDSPFRVYVGGQAANQRDFVDAVQRGAPIAITIVVLATFVLLFLMTGSILVPLKALLINTMSLAAALGVVTWVFQYGNLEGLLQFTSAGGLETYVVVLIVAFGFGLAMDYDLFLLARVKELVDRGVSNDEAVQRGLQRSGRIITSAAAVIILVFLGFAFGELLVIKQVGFGLAFAVFLDATVVRMLLVPSTMTLLGDRNWWAPTPLRKLHERFAIKH